MKKFVSLAAATAIAAAVAAPALSADNNPKVYINDIEILFADQKAVILNDRTLVPARGVFEAMGATVDWDGEKREVQVTSADNKTIVKLVIDNETMNVYDISGVIGGALLGGFKAPVTPVVLDVAPQIINDRTMIPLRAISEAIDAKVDWNEATYSVEITTADRMAELANEKPTVSASPVPTATSVPTGTPKPSGAPEGGTSGGQASVRTGSPSEDNGLPSVYLTSSKEKVAKNEEFSIYVNVRNLPEESYVSSVTATIKYDLSKFEILDAVLVNGDKTIDSAIGGFNEKYKNEFVKIAYVTMGSRDAVTSDGAVIRVDVKSLTGEKGEFELSNAYDTVRGYNTDLAVDYEDDDRSEVAYEGLNLNVSKDKLVVNAK